MDLTTNGVVIIDAIKFVQINKEKLSMSTKEEDKGNKESKEPTQALATNVTGITVPFSGHWIPEEQPQFVIEQLAKFFNE